VERDLRWEGGGQGGTVGEGGGKFLGQRPLLVLPKD